MKKLLSVSEYCKFYHKDPGNVRRLLINGRIKGQKIGNQWVIELDEEYPKDGRVKSGKYKNFKKKQILNSNKKLMKQIRNMNNELILSYKDKIVKIVIYGSYARNEEKRNSDVDIAVFVKENFNRKKMTSIVAKYELETGKVLSVLDIKEKDYKKNYKYEPFYRSIESEGIELWRKN